MNIKVFFSVLAVAIITLTGCNKQTELEINYGKTAKLEGKVTIFNNENSTSEVATNVNVYAEVSYADMITTDVENRPSGKKTFNTTTDENGVYSFEIPVTGYTSSGISLYTELKEINGNLYVGKEDNCTFDARQGAITYKNINMYSTQMSETTITIRGKVVISTSTTEVPANGFEVKTTMLYKTFKTITNSNGEYEFQLPYIDYAPITIIVPSQEINGKTYTEGNILLQIYGNKVEYEANTTISIYEY